MAKVGQLRLAKVGQIFLAKVGLAKVGQIRMAKVGLTKVGLSRSRGGLVSRCPPAHLTWLKKMGRRGFALESASCQGLQGSRWTGGHKFVRPQHGPGVPSAGNTRRLEVVVDGLLLFGGAQLAVDTTLVSAAKGNGEPRRSAADRDGVALAAAPRVKERTYPELVDLGRRARLVVFALEVGGRWSEEAKIFIRLPARAQSKTSGASVETEVARNHLMCRGEILCVSVGPAGVRV